MKQQIMTKKDLELFKQLVSLRQNPLKKTLSKYVKKKYKKVIETKDYICAVGDIPITLVAHMDTVFTTPVKQMFYDRVYNVLWSPQGLGADDRAGVFSIIKILQEGLRPHIILTTDEEKGALGANELVKNIETPFADMNYIIELDRRGSNDCVFYDCDNEEFTKYIESFGFNTALGSFSDISVIAEAWGIAAVNLSIGYYSEHSVSETLYVGQMFNTINRVIQMLKEKEIPKFKFIPYEYKWYGYTGKYIYDGYYDNYSSITQEACIGCNKILYSHELVPVKMKNGETEMMCPDCLTRFTNWCYSCQEPYEDDGYIHESGIHLCQDCRPKGED